MRQLLARQRKLAWIVLLGTVILAVSAVVAGPWPLLVWGGAVVVAVATDVVKGSLQRHVEAVLGPASASPLTLTVRMEVGPYARFTDESGTALVPVSGHSVDITVETSSPQAVILRRLVPVVDTRSPADHTALLPHLGAMPVRRMRLWLDHTPPRLCVEEGPGFPFKVTAQDPEIFSVIALVDEGCVSWHLDLEWSRDGTDGTHRIDLDGSPFRTVSAERMGTT